MSREFPDFIDPWRAAEGGKRIGGTIPLMRFKRLAPLLASNEGEADFDLQFGYDAQRRATVTAVVSAPLWLTCQRSLEPYIEQISQHSLLQIIGDPGEESLLSDEEEFVLVEEGRVAVADLVEDELLLGVPQVPRNPAVDAVRVVTRPPETPTGGDDRASGENGGGGSQRPFEDLAEMLKNS